MNSVAPMNAANNSTEDLTAQINDHIDRIRETVTDTDARERAARLLLSLQDTDGGSLGRATAFTILMELATIW